MFTKGFEESADKLLYISTDIKNWPATSPVNSTQTLREVINKFTGTKVVYLKNGTGNDMLVVDHLMPGRLLDTFT